MRGAFALLLAAVFLVGCGSKKPAVAAATPSPTPATQVLRGVDLTLEAGAPVKKDVEAVIDANAKRNQDVQNLADPKD